ncbi:hypothetical protein BpHYR1_009545 [Brachionus plicatilis]|uniref:Uncharacterized protein n=1 Tax=Brachionus plicatilis TaxID=10195 RepID=A0A3M7Q3B1_BRAPC|nr:hypothetical protein BpHYR1_009545 [Brachionus plicatilis]
MENLDDFGSVGRLNASKLSLECFAKALNQKSLAGLMKKKNSGLGLDLRLVTFNQLCFEWRKKYFLLNLEWFCQGFERKFFFETEHKHKY